jgi:hypothetical protein
MGDCSIRHGVHFVPEYAGAAHDRRYIDQSRALWKLADHVGVFKSKMEGKNIHGVCQSTEFDALSATKRTL